MLELIRLFFLSYFKEFTFLRFHLICFRDNQSFIQNIEDEIKNVEKFKIMLKTKELAEISVRDNKIYCKCDENEGDSKALIKAKKSFMKIMERLRDEERSIK